jgi:hypothetical protein
LAQQPAFEDHANLPALELCRTYERHYLQRGSLGWRLVIKVVVEILITPIEVWIIQTRWAWVTSRRQHSPIPKPDLAFNITPCATRIVANGRGTGILGRHHNLGHQVPLHAVGVRIESANKAQAGELHHLTVHVAIDAIGP